MRDYEHRVYVRDEVVDGHGPWYWAKGDSGAWEGPKSDWEGSHKHKWFRHVKDFRICVQAGSCLGVYPRLLIERFERVYTFEPNALNHYVAGLNCQVDGIHRFNAALGEERAFVGMKLADIGNVGMHRTEGDGSIPIMTVDSFNFPFLGLLALDIEGYEIHALRGAVETIRRCSPVVVCEMPSETVRSLLTELGYEEDCRSVSDTVFVRTGQT